MPGGSHCGQAEVWRRRKKAGQAQAAAACGSDGGRSGRRLWGDRRPPSISHASQLLPGGPQSAGKDASGLQSGRSAPHHGWPAFQTIPERRKLVQRAKGSRSCTFRPLSNLLNACPAAAASRTLLPVDSRVWEPIRQRKASVGTAHAARCSTAGHSLAAQQCQSRFPRSPPSACSPPSYFPSPAPPESPPAPQPPLSRPWPAWGHRPPGMKRGRDGEGAGPPAKKAAGCATHHDAFAPPWPAALL